MNNLENFRIWLSNNNLTIYYILANETDTDY